MSLANQAQQPDWQTSVPLARRAREALRLLLELRKADFQAASTYVGLRYPGTPFPLNWCRFLAWAVYQMWVAIPAAMQHLSLAEQISRTPMWLTDPNPLANHPWSQQPRATLPPETDVVVIGAGFTGSAAAYHWARRAPAERRLVVLESDDPASGSSGRNEGLVVMGRYYALVRDKVQRHLARVRPQLGPKQRSQLAGQFAYRYCRAAYRNADLIEATIRREQFDCGYRRAGWVQARTEDEQAALSETVKLAVESGCDDWTSISPAEVWQKSGMRVQHNAGFSIAAASWHPAKWVWCLLQAALREPQVQLFTRTAVTRIEDEGDWYRITASRGVIRARHLVLATESYTPQLLRRFHDAILPLQEQAASGQGGPASMREHVGISGTWFFAGRYGQRVLFGSGGSRVPDREAGRNLPSRFLTKFVAAEMLRSFGAYRLLMTNEWSGTVGYTPDEYPIVGTVDGKRQYIAAGMCGSGSGVSFNAARCLVNRILQLTDEPDDYPAEYFAPSRLLAPTRHGWPEIEDGSG